MRSIHLQCLAFIVGVSCFACEAGPRAQDSGSQPSSSANDAPGAGTASPPVGADGLTQLPSAGPVGAAAGAIMPGAGAAPDAPLVCPFCKPDPGGQTGDFGEGLSVKPCPKAPYALDAALAQRFRVDELHAAIDREFSHSLRWGELDPNTNKFTNPGSETTIDIALSLGDFTYNECDDAVYAPVMVRLDTGDGRLGTTAHGWLRVTGLELGWPAASGPAFAFNARDNLSNARGTFDLEADPSKVQSAELLINISGSARGVYGSLRLQLLEYPDEQARADAQLPTDMPSTVTIFERGMAVFPSDACERGGFLVAADAPRDELGGASMLDLFAAQQGLIDAVNAEDQARWLSDGAATRMTLDVGAQPSGPLCFELWSMGYGVWTVTLPSSAHISTDDGRLDARFSKAEVSIEPYSTTVTRLVLTTEGPGSIVEVNPEAGGVPFNGWVERNDGQGDEVRWPACNLSATGCSATP